VDEGLSLDLTLLHGFRYACQPECGLCCYAEPRVEVAERPALLHLLPRPELTRRAGGEFLAARPDGGACGLLAHCRCSGWAARPGVCRQFPVSVHVAERLQATLVLSCPGIDLTSLAESLPWSKRPEPVGLRSEIDAARRRVSPAVARSVAEARRRRRRVARALERTGQWTDEEAVRRELRGSVPLPSAADYPAPDPPSAEEGLATLPLFFDHRSGPVALAEGLGGWQLLELRAEGGAEPLAVVPPPTQPPALAPEGLRLLRGYLQYFLERDALFGAVVPEVVPGSPEGVQDAVAAELRAIGAMVVSRADVRRRARVSTDGPLSATEVADGIRACDQELLDRPTWGDRF
jgi:Fe-S-cluster containining protein